MPFKLYVTPSLERCLKKLGSDEKATALLILEAMLQYFQSGAATPASVYMFHQESRHYRLVFKKLRGQIWEAYLEGRVRVLTRLDHDTHFAVFAGNHDQVSRFLKES